MSLIKTSNNLQYSINPARYKGREGWLEMTTFQYQCSVGSSPLT